MNDTKRSGSTSITVGRREFVLGTTATLLSTQLAFAASPACSPYAQPIIDFNDHLAVPIPANPPLGKGKDRALVLGGGWRVFRRVDAWLCQWPQGKGVPYDLPDIIVGTSAGSLVGSTIAGGHLERLTNEFDFFGTSQRSLLLWCQLRPPTQARFVPGTSAKSPMTAASRRSSGSVVELWLQATLQSPSCKT